MRAPRAALAAGLAVVLVNAWPEASRAQVPAGGEFRVNTFTSGNQAHPAVASDALGNFVVAWDSFYRNVGTIRGQRFTAAGAALGAEFEASGAAAQSAYHPGLAVDPAGRFVVAWDDYADGSYTGVVGQRFGLDGARLGSEFLANTQTTGVQSRPVLAAHPRGFVVAWQGEQTLGDVFARRYDAAGLPLGVEFRVNTVSYGSQEQPALAADRDGAFVVVWTAQDEHGLGVFGRRFDPAGAPRGQEFRVNSFTTGSQHDPAVSSDGAGTLVVVWLSTDQGGVGDRVVGQRVGSGGALAGAEFQVQTATPSARSPRVSADEHGNFVVAWNARQDGSGYGVMARRFDAAALPRSGEFLVNASTTGDQSQPQLASDPAGNFVVAWAAQQDGDGEGVFARRFGGLHPAALSVDASPTGQSDTNGVLEPGEEVSVAPAWRNATGASQSISGGAPALTGPSGPSYMLLDAAAAYGAVANGASGSCAATSDCYRVSVSGARPAAHWDARLREDLLPATQGQTKGWALHLGDTFSDVPRGNLFYRFVETIVHHGVTSGCGAGVYCPAVPTTRAQMAVFVLAAREGAGYAPPPCTTPAFDDVPASSPFCPWIEELARRGVAAGCGGRNYCPSGGVTRGAMAVFVLATREPGTAPPACGTPIFNDVPASSPFCPWVEELARRGVVAGCGNGNYCPTDPVFRGTMSVFLSATFGLSLYGP